jgi:hypothetical protein
MPSLGGHAVIADVRGKRNVPRICYAQNLITIYNIMRYMDDAIGRRLYSVLDER